MGSPRQWANRCVSCTKLQLTDVPGKTYDVGVTNIEDLTPGSSTFSKIAKFYPCRGLNSFPHVQELGALTKELASPL